jgi:hypothetical protein
MKKIAPSAIKNRSIGNKNRPKLCPIKRVFLLNDFFGQNIDIVLTKWLKFSAD